MDNGIVLQWIIYAVLLIVVASIVTYAIFITVAKTLSIITTIFKFILTSSSRVIEMSLALLIVYFIVSYLENRNTDVPVKPAEGFMNSITKRFSDITSDRHKENDNYFCKTDSTFLCSVLGYLNYNEEKKIEEVSSYESLLQNAILGDSGYYSTFKKWMYTNMWSYITSVTLENDKRDNNGNRNKGIKGFL